MLGDAKGGKKSEFLASTKAAREQRMAERERETAAVKIQALIRGFINRRRLKKRLVADLDAVIDEWTTALVAFKAASAFLNLAFDEDYERLNSFCGRVLESLESSSSKVSYISVSLNKEFALRWIAHIKKLLLACSRRLADLGAKSAKEAPTLLRMLVSFTATNTWALIKANKALSGMSQLCSNWMGFLVQNGFYGHLKKALLRGLCSSSSSTALKKTSLAALMTLCVRPVVGADFSDKLVSIFLLNAFSVPGLVVHLESMSPESLALLRKHDFLGKSIALLSSDQQLKIHFNALEGSYALCLTANLIHLLSLEDDLTTDFIGVVAVFTRLLESCGQYVTAKQSNLSHWHPVLGWFSVHLDSYLQNSMELVRSQLSKLWSSHTLTVMAKPLKELKLPELPSPPAVTTSPDNLQAEDTNVAKAFFKKAMEKTKASSSSTATPIPKGGYTKLGSPECMKVALVCNMYQVALKTLSQLKLDILSGLCYKNILLLPLWRLIRSLGPNCGLKTFLDHLHANSKGSAPEFQILTLFCDCLTYVVTLLDDVEMYEKQTPFTLGQYLQISAFLNAFLFKAASSGLLTDPKSQLFSSLHSLLMALYSRDNRRAYAPPQHWLIKELRVSSFTADLDKGKKSATLLVQKMPHVLPHEERVVLFRRKITADKTSLGLADADSSSQHSTLVTIHRSRIVEDGDRQLSTISTNALKGIIRVKFVNVQGLDEAGIDQDGVFKEFLEETIKKVFDPGLNLFCTTSDERLYPSPLSHMTDNHLHLFEFVGKMIGKAVYEGIVVDVPFAPFFLSQVLGKDHSTAFYSYIDELPSLDDELYRNLTYMKHYEGDVADLDLTFSLDQDMMGQIVTHELIPGGRGVAVTNENRIRYMHHVAHFRMHTQIREQTAAFTRGFRSIISPEWLQLFASPEVQRLISGDNSPLDLKDLRKHTHYYGGFHDSHRVVSWLWDVLEKDLSPKERGAFLKFVTSCSKPPLLGFEHLEPPFSIRCVEVADDDDDGDTVGSVLRGFLALRRRDPVNRLPTASTCFNLLKLPNYQKKSTLREKLRYAMSSNTGFELS